MQISCPNCHRTNKLESEKLQHQPSCGACKAPLLSAQVINVDTLQFNKHRQFCHLPILVDFWADWCAPCKMMAPALDQIAKVEQKIQVLKVNTQHNQSLAQTYQIRSIPTLILFKAGKEIARQSGALNKTQLQQWLTENLP